jgi:hypothetical protein
MAAAQQAGTVGVSMMMRFGVAAVRIQGPCTFLLWSDRLLAANSPHLPGVQYRLVFHETRSARVLLHGSAATIPPRRAS